MLVPENSHSNDTRSPSTTGSPRIFQEASGAAVRKLSITPVFAASFPVSGVPTEAS